MEASMLMTPGTRGVLDAAQKAAMELNLELSDEALEAIEQRASPAMTSLDELTLTRHAEEIQINTQEFIRFVFQTQLSSVAGEVTLTHIANAFSSYCQKHPNQLPFCR